MVNKIITSRKSIVCFSERMIEMAVLQNIFDATRYAPSSYNQQPWRFIAGIKSTKSYGIILDSLSDKNKTWAQRAPVLAFSIAESISKINNSQNRFALHDTALAYSNLVFQANSVDISVHPMGGFISKTLQDSFYIPDGFEPIIAFAMGYKGDCEGLPEEIINREKQKTTRKDLSQIVYTDTWENPLFT